MNDLELYFRNNKGRLIHKWDHYFEVYDAHFSRFRNKDVTILEIGVSQGGSLQMWKHYFGSKAKIYGIDINPECKGFEEENIKIFIGSQSDRNFLKDVVASIPSIDILIDDGGHFMKQQIISFQELFNHIKEDGVYLCEDCETSYLPEYGGGVKRPGSYIEYSKNWIDDINAWYSKEKRLPVNERTKSMKSVHFYNGIVVVEKGKTTQPVHTMTGIKSFSGPISQPAPTSIFNRIYIKNKVNRILNSLKLPYIE